MVRGKGIIDELDIYGMHLKLYYENDSEPHMTVERLDSQVTGFNDTAITNTTFPIHPKMKRQVSLRPIIDTSYELSLVKVTRFVL